MSHHLDCPPHWTALDCAAHRLVHGFRHGDKKGAQAMAPFVNKSPASLSNEVNPDYAGAKFGLNDAVSCELAATSFPILHAHAQMVRHICWQLPDPDLNVSDIELLTKFAEWQAAIGDTCAEIHHALDPNGPNGSRINKGELERIHAAGQHHMRHFMELLERLRFIADPN